MNRRALLIRLGLLGGAVAGGWWFKDNVLWPTPRPEFPDGATPWLSFRAPAVTPTIDVEVGGVPTVALIDTGAQYSVLDRSLHEQLAAAGRERLNFPMPLLAYGVGGRPQIGRGAVVDVETEGLSLPGLRAAILDLGPIADLTRGLGARLILGQDALHTMVLDVETTARRSRLSAPGALPLRPDARPLASRLRAGALRLDVTLEGHSLEALVDTGASALLALSSRSAEELGLLDGRELSSGSSLVLGGQVGANLARARTVGVGGRTFADAEVAIYGDVKAPGFPRALLGMAAFSGQAVRIDLARGALWTAGVPEPTVVPRRRRRR
jgi:predicted aspartyl protease